MGRKPPKRLGAARSPAGKAAAEKKANAEAVPATVEGESGAKRSRASTAVTIPNTAKKSSQAKRPAAKVAGQVRRVFCASPARRVCPVALDSAQVVCTVRLSVRGLEWMPPARPDRLRPHRQGRSATRAVAGHATNSSRTTKRVVKVLQSTVPPRLPHRVEAACCRCGEPRPRMRGSCARIPCVWPSRLLMPTPRSATDSATAQLVSCALRVPRRRVRAARRLGTAARPMSR